eukprot:scaffold287791_cov13-Tisochrysis_lutea.AAC.1
MQHTASVLECLAGSLAAMGNRMAKQSYCLSSKKPALQPHLLYFADDSPSRSNGLQLAVPVVG